VTKLQFTSKKKQLVYKELRNDDVVY